MRLLKAGRQRHADCLTDSVSSSTKCSKMDSYNKGEEKVISDQKLKRE